MKAKKRKNGVWDIALFVLTLFLFLGVTLLFGPCAPREDGTFMTCHWAGEAVRAVSAGMAVLAALQMALREKTRLGIALSLCAMSAVCFFLPGGFISLCTMHSMTCQAVFNPAVKVISALIFVTGTSNVCLEWKKSRN